MTTTTTALVVGASRGIGHAIALALLEDAGIHRVYATFRSTATAESLLDIDDTRLRVIEADVTDEPGLERMAERITDEGDQPDLVIHCAGILHEGRVQPEKTLRQCDPESLRRIFEVNSIGALLVAKAVLPIMPRKRRAHFGVLSAMVGSISDNRLGGWYGYRASKAALNQFMRTLAIECRRTHHRLCITSIHPGTTDTELSRPFQANVKPGRLYTPQQSARRIIRVIVGGRPEDSGRFVNWNGTPIRP